jgi:transcription-repair coupling factor (superfamily II helicase)
MLKWRENIKKWFLDSGVRYNLISDADEDTLAPLVLKERLTYGKTTVIVLPVMNQAEHLAAGIAAWNREFKLGFQSLYLPETMEGGKYVPENEADRARALYDSLKSKYDIIIGSAASFLAPAPDPETVLAAEIVLRPETEYSFTGLLKKLVELDYDDEFEVNVKGEFSRRGGIIDVFSPSCEYPVRIEFWGDRIETMRKFSPDNQRSIEKVDEYRIIGRSGLDANNAGVDFFNYLDKISAELIVVFPDECMEHLENFSSEAEIKRFKSALEKYAHGRLVRMLDAAGDASLEHKRSSDCFPAVTHLKKSLPEEIRGGGMEILRKLISDQIRQWLDTGYTVALLSSDKASCAHIKRWCKLYEIDQAKVEIDVAGISEGVIFPPAKTVFLGEKELFTANLFKRKSSSLPVSPSQPAAAIEEEAAAFADLDEGDYAVHLIHGIGIFRGFREIDAKGVKREVIVLEYQDNALLYVPVWQAGMVSRYIGSQSAVTLHKIGGRKWATAKLEAVKAVRDFAADMLRFQAMRNSTEGTMFPEDDLEQRVFEDAFPYEDTVDQKRAVIEIKADMRKSRPMDRLLCGDVGYGKTEVAIRVAFKTVMAGYQVAILVPTTVLAQQHYYSFTERFAQYPVVIEMLSRFRSPAEQRQIVEKMRSGGIDIIIGTHRLIQEDVAFAKLGLVIIDEEQRFGVKHKERLKHFRAAVDVLTMSATPIPRTLYMAMIGARDLSAIMTAPGLRLPIQTIVSHYENQSGKKSSAADRFSIYTTGLKRSGKLPTISSVCCRKPGSRSDTDRWKKRIWKCP